MKSLTKVLVLLALLLLPALSRGAGNEPFNPVPSVPWTPLSTELIRQWQLGELPAVFSKYFHSDFVTSGGLHSTSATCISPSFGLSAFTSSGNHITADGSGGSIAIDYCSAPISAAVNDVCWVVGSNVGTATLAGTSYVRVPSTNIYVDCTSSAEPTLPTDSVRLMKTVISSSVITVVSDLRRPSSYSMLSVYDPTDPLYGAVGDGVTDDTAAFQAAITPGGTVICAAGKNYKITSTLTVVNAIHLIGLGTSPGGVTTTDPRWHGCAIDHHFNGTLFNIIGLSGDSISSLGTILENIILRQTFGNGSSSAGIAINVVATNDDFKVSWVRIKEVNLELNVGVTDDWTWGVVFDGDATISTTVTGSRDNAVLGGRWFLGANSTGAVKIRAGANIRIVDTLFNGAKSIISISGKDSDHKTFNTQIVNISSNAAISLDWAIGTVISGSNVTDVITTANTTNTDFSGFISTFPSSLLGVNNIVRSGSTTYYSAGTYSTVKTVSGTSASMVDSAAGQLSIIEFLDAGALKWFTGKRGDGVFFIAQNDPANPIITIDSSGVFRTVLGTAKRGIAPTYGPTVTLDCSIADIFQVDVTDASNFTIQPIGLISNQVVIVYVRNMFNGAMGTITWNNTSLAGAFVNPAFLNQRAVTFRSNGFTLLELNRTAADVAY